MARNGHEQAILSGYLLPVGCAYAAARTTAGPQGERTRMSVSTLDASDAAPLCLDGSIEWSDPDTECTLVVSEPKSEPTLWAEYVRGAQDSYRKHGVERALDQASLRHPSETSLFLGAVDQSGRMVAGVRAKGPYLDADESHATIEWAGQPGLPTVRKLIADRIPFGVVEIKTAWV